MPVFPKMARIKLGFEVPEIANVSARLWEELASTPIPVEEGSKIGIAVGSRGIYKLQEMVRTLVHYLQGKGAKPVIIPAMGSHGGATAEGQKEILAGYGISEKELAIPIEASMDTICLGYIKGDIPVFFSKIAARLDGVVLLNRIKPHTDFRAPYESGLMKQMAIGLGGHRGAQNIHSYGISNLKELIPASAELILQKVPILAGIAILENARDRTAEIQVLQARDIPRREPELLQKARDLMPYLPFTAIDVLVVEEMGKSISGVGIDPNITGRTLIRLGEDWGNKKISRIVCLDLTSESHGNAQGVGLADVITRRLYNKIDFSKMYVNVAANNRLELAFIPVVQEHDQAAMDLALKCCERKITPANARMVQIKNTLELEEMFVSLPLLEEIDARIPWDKVADFSYAFSDKGELLNLIKK